MKSSPNHKTVLFQKNIEAQYPEFQLKVTNISKNGERLADTLHLNDWSTFEGCFKNDTAYIWVDVDDLWEFWKGFRDSNDISIAYSNRILNRRFFFPIENIRILSPKHCMKNPHRYHLGYCLEDTDSVENVFSQMNPDVRFVGITPSAAVSWYIETYDSYLGYFYKIHTFYQEDFKQGASV